MPANILVGSADINSDGINGDLAARYAPGQPGPRNDDRRGAERLIRAYNLSLAGTLNPRGQRLPFLVEMPDGTRFGDSFISQDIQLSYILQVAGHVRIEATAQMFNAFNVSNLVGPAGLPSSPYGGTLPTLNTLPAGFTLASNGSVRDASGNQALAGTTRLPNGNLIATRPSAVSARRGLAADRNRPTPRGPIRVQGQLLRSGGNFIHFFRK